MIQIKSNTQTVITEMAEKLGLILDGRKMMVAVASAVLPVMKKRVHEDGKDSSGNAIGQYSEGYMKVRTGVFGNSGRYVKGEKKGMPKNTGVFTKGKQKGAPRPKYNRSNDTKVVISLTRQMENDMVVIPTELGAGIGYNNSHNLQKVEWMEDPKDGVYKKPILSQLTTAEIDIAIDTAEQYVDEIAKSL